MTKDADNGSPAKAGNVKTLKKKRKLVRKAHTEAVSRLQALLKVEKHNVIDVQKAFDVLKIKREELAGLDAAIEDLVLETMSEEDYEKEYSVVDKYKTEFLEIQTEFEMFNRAMVRKEAQETNEKEEASVKEGLADIGSKLMGLNLTKKFNMKYPKLDVEAFDGNTKEWLNWWSQFRKIDKNGDFDDDDRMHYLYQYTKGKARTLINMYPKTGANYIAALEHLKSRFASDRKLLRCYVRQLYDLLLTNSLQGSVIVFYEQLQSILNSLITLNLAPEKHTDFLLPLIEAALPDDIIRLWHRHRHTKLEGSSGASLVTEPDSDDELKLILEFLRCEVESLDSISDIRYGFTNKLSENQGLNQPPLPLSTPSPTPTATFLLKGQVTDSCIFCGDEVRAKTHKSVDCFSVRQWDVLKRRRHVERIQGCFLCFQPYHNARDCSIKTACYCCNGRHHILLCERFVVASRNPGKGSQERPESEKAKIEDKKAEKAQDKRGKEPVLLQNFHSSVMLDYLLRNDNFHPAVRVRVVSATGTRIVRLFFDTGCTKSYALNSLIAELGLQSVGKETVSDVLWGNKLQPPRVYNLYDLELHSLDDKFRCKIRVRNSDEISNYISPVPQESLPYFKDILFSDVGKNDPIEVSIGSDIFGFFWTGDKLFAPNGLIAIKTQLGWTLSGGIGTSGFSLLSACVNKRSLADLWDLEALGIMDPGEAKTKALINEDTLKHFLATIRRLEDRRYQVRMPWLRDRADLLSNFAVAFKRLEKITDGLGQFYEPYDDTFKCWYDIDITEDITGMEGATEGYFLPHRPVITLQKETTKIRPVFDASAKPKGGFSLNECLSTGPNLLENIIPLLIRFRMKRIGVVADIEKAFLQISVHPDDRAVLKFLWWQEDRKSIRIFQHKRVVFGVCASPFLLNATIAYHLDQFKTDDFVSEATIEQLKRSFYVDDNATSVDDTEELNRYIKEAEIVMRDASFNLRGWKATQIGGTEESIPITTTVLGIQWDRRQDTLTCDARFKRDGKNTVLSKRELLSLVNRIFDPLGITAPATIIPKILIQQTWDKKLKWDEGLPPELLKKAESWLREIEYLNKCAIPRWLFGGPMERDTTSLHIFSDASGLAYAGCIFVRSETSLETRVQMVLAKARVAPLKRKLTIPRLELMGATVAARLYDTIHSEFPAVKTYFWSDSTIVVTWIRGQGPWLPFVHNRVREISDLTTAQDWHHVSGVNNPADLPSRGCSPKELLEGKWWEGPPWLYEPESSWNIKEDFIPDDAADAEKRKTVVCNFRSEITRIRYLDELIKNGKSYTTVVQALAYIKRFIKNKFLAKNAEDKVIDSYLTSSEVEWAETFLLKYVQQDLLLEKCAKRINTLPVIDDDQGIRRIQTRLLEGVQISCCSKPILLPHTAPLTRLLIREKHRELHHAGVNAIMTALREQFWILLPRRTIKQAVKDCFRCEMVSAKSADAPMPALPNDRLEATKAFQIIGVDLAGPLILDDGRKVWICIFTCAVYRAIHLEIVESADTESFILALRRFIARRGRVSTIYSDNGGNFAKTDHLFDLISWDELARFCTTRRIRWKFNPPTGSWWGGFWERMIGVVKGLLRKTLGKASLRLDELTTVIYEVEAVINSRPLTYQSDDAKEIVALTPSLFIQPNVEIDTADLDNLDEKGLVKRGRHILEIRQHLQTRFQSEYLSALINRKKSRMRTLKVGDVCLIGSDNKKRIEWPLGRIIEIQQGKDGIGRVIKLQTKAGVLIRPLQRIFPLELSFPNPRESHDINDVPNGTKPGLDDTSDLDNKNLDQSDPQSVSGFKDKLPLDAGLVSSESGSENTEVPLKVTSRGRVVKPRQVLDL